MREIDFALEGPKSLTPLPSPRSGARGEGRERLRVSYLHLTRNPLRRSVDYSSSVFCSEPAMVAIALSSVISAL